MTQVMVAMRDALNGRVSICGHAGDERICAAISTLTGAVLNVLRDAAQNVIYESGNVEFDVKFSDGLQMGAFEVLMEAFSMLSESFPEMVGVTVESAASL